jgi:hypothetical protein
MIKLVMKKAAELNLLTLSLSWSTATVNIAQPLLKYQNFQEQRIRRWLIQPLTSAEKNNAQKGTPDIPSALSYKVPNPTGGPTHAHLDRHSDRSGPSVVRRG